MKLRRAAGALACVAVTLSVGGGAAHVRRSADADVAMSSAAHRYLTEALDIIRSKAVQRGRVDWAYQERIALRVAAGARTPAETRPAIASAIAALGDPHSRFLPPVQVQQWSGTELARRVPSGRIIGLRVAYLKVPGILGSEAAAADYARAGGPPCSGSTVALLTGPRTISAGETIVIAFKGRPGTRVFGLPTAGLATATEGFPLSDGAMLLLTTAYNVYRRGTVYGNTPIAPDEVPTGGGDNHTRRAAAAWLREQPACRH